MATLLAFNIVGVLGGREEPSLDNNVAAACTGEGCVDDEKVDHNETEENDEEEDEDYYLEWEGDPNFRFDEYYVNGVNLASYDPSQPPQKYDGNVEPFELFEDLDISYKLTGDEDWWTMRLHKKSHSKVRPSLSFYYDKVASKRWLMDIGVPIPKIFALNYLSELVTDEDNPRSVFHAIRKLLPEGRDYCIKPNNGAMWRGVWLVTQDEEKKTNQTWSIMEDNEWGLEGMQRWPKNYYTADEVAVDVTAALVTPLERGLEGFPRSYIEKGVVIEERFVAFDDVLQPALEFKVQVIWGRVFLANWVRGEFELPWEPGQVYRNGTMVKGSTEEKIPDWVDWNRVVELAEQVGANKDFFRADIFVGVPADSPALREGATDEERRAAVQYAVSETQTNSGESPPDPILDEAVRLWTAGYKIGNYRLVPNTDVPSDYKPRSLPSAPKQRIEF